jgi:hypothetical protein
MTIESGASPVSELIASLAEKILTSVAFAWPH